MLRNYRWLQTMVFTIEEINRSPILLPNLTLGYLAFDTCLQEQTTVGAALAMMTGQEAAVWGSSCTGSPQVPIIIGDARSSGSLAVARTLGIFDIPMVSYFASCACLSDRQKYPNFFRTVPSDAFQAKELAHLLQLLGWAWIGVVFGDDDYGHYGVQLLLKELQGSNVCVAFSQVIPKAHNPQRIRHIVETIRLSTARVVVIFAITNDAQVILEEVVRQNISDRQWIGTEGWVTSPDISTPQNLPSLVGTLGFALRKAQIPGLGSFLTSIKPAGSRTEPFVREFWETLFECSLEGNSSSGDNRPRCTGTESVEKKANSYSDVTQLGVSYNVYKAVYAVAHAIQDMLACPPGQGPFQNGTCPNVNKIAPKQLLHYLKKVNFTTPLGDTVNFDMNGDPSASYDIINWHIGDGGKAEFVKVGQYDSSRGPGQKLQLDIAKVVWGGGWTSKIPVSVCSTPCTPGTRKALQKGRPVCCFDCVQCPDGEISNETGATECITCPEHFWSNDQRTECVLKQEEFLSFVETMGIVLTALSISGALLTSAVLVTFIRHRDTPLVRANNSELSFLLLLSLILCFLCAMSFIGRPLAWSCMLRHTLFGVTFVVCISCILSKTVVVLVAFRATLPGSNLMRYFGPAQQRIGICVCTLIQVLVCVLWLTLDPPLPSQNKATIRSATVVLECAAHSLAGFAALLGYIGLLATVCFLLAFFARRLPDNFNEAKFITFSMLIFCAVWIAFVPAYVSSPGKYTVAVEIFAILASSYGLLLCIFAPKCYIILFQPQKNTKKSMMAK
ncbi:extracellular calcium-sensing receptor-like [Alosa sapidissima]|uniref:extracellular calcium-sensing receptor-like n=1 Tax=Alosa sapidissima TaxID=34773 RepID=UPI001C09B4ED|nr:extracellular calcium-sensing receptor-like [Alosa sapidissima]